MTKCDEDNEVSGFWKLVGRQALTINLDNDVRLIAHMRYHMKDDKKATS